MTGMTSIVKTIARLLEGLMFVYGMYVILHGHLTPGGGFAGGVIIAGAFVLHVLANGSPQEALEARKAAASGTESAGIFSFWVVALIGLLAGAWWFQNVLGPGTPFTLPSAGLIPVSNLAIGIEVAAALVCIYVALLIVRRGGQA